MGLIITIDGPVASGKSTVSRMLANNLGYYYLCSGLLYRALGYLLINKFFYTQETIGNPRAEDIKACFDGQKFSYQYNKETQEHIFFEDQDITVHLKERLIDKITSLLSVNEQVRAAVTTMQRDIAHNHNIVTDGRDVGSVVFPHADVKFFITASVEVRAERWRKDQEKYGNNLTLSQAAALITDRDNRDKNRTIAPLIVPKDGIVIDTSALNIQQAVTIVTQHINGCVPGLF